MVQVYRSSSIPPPTPPPQLAQSAPFLISTAFPPTSPDSFHPSDLILLSSDLVFFHVHRSALQAASTRAFRISFPSLPPSSSDIVEPVISIPESSTTLNIILHSIYGQSSFRFAPSFEALSAAVAALLPNELSVREFVALTSPLGALILAHAPLHPIEAYALAAQYDLHDLAVVTSSHLLSFNLSSVTDELAEQIGPRYLKRLFLLHFGRIEALKRLLMPPPHPHPATPTCPFTAQSKVVRAWTLMAAYLIWDCGVDLSTETIKSIMGPMADHIQCPICRDSLKSRMQTLVVQWTNIKVSYRSHINL
ncbi:hypothetical protein BV22DRAFT_1022514 [Leucogyrophana mollusca]|uniref:Uncharacterized protein n=1 Tax=Leucogyrophana mollusca TaxID=85980 RepID=A0ACB8B375_9AGAM|nr:hypothetical protein BV22DRAFT_1022514 [Leucogyrophana mollusca]